MGTVIRFGQPWENPDEHLKDHPFYKLRQQKGYDWSHLFGAKPRWLTWGEATCDNPGVFDGLFPMPEFSRAPRTGYVTDVAPVLPWLSADYVVRINGEPRPAIRMQDVKDTRERHESLKAEIASDGHVALGATADLIAHREAVEKQLRRIYAKARPPLEEARGVLKVWYVEAKHPIFNKGTAFDGSTDEERAEALHWLQYVAGELWRTISAGAPAEHLEGPLAHALSQKGLPEGFAEAQMHGVLRHVKKRSPLIESARPLNAQRKAIEFILKRALVGEPVMTEAEVERESSASQEYHGNAHHERNWRWIVKTWDALLDSGVGVEEEIKSAVQEQYAKEFGREISRSTVRRIYKKHKN